MCEEMTSHRIRNLWQAPANLERLSREIWVVSDEILHEIVKNLKFTAHFIRIRSDATR